MSNDKEFTIANPSSLDANGGEDLDGSGFEEETSGQRIHAIRARA